LPGAERKIKTWNANSGEKESPVSKERKGKRGRRERIVISRRRNEYEKRGKRTRSKSPRLKKDRRKEMSSSSTPKKEKMFDSLEKKKQS